MQIYENLPFHTITGNIINCAYEVMRELGSGFLESVYKNALVMALNEHKINTAIEQVFPVYFREQKVGLYIADIVVEKTAIVELKCCKTLLPEHLAQTINYLSAANLPVGLVINFGRRNLEFKRVYHSTPERCECSALSAL